MYKEDLDTKGFKDSISKECKGTALQAMKYDLHTLMMRWDELEMVEDKDGYVYGEQDNNLLMQDMLRKLIRKAEAERLGN